MRKKVWLLLVVMSVLLAAYVVRRASTPSSVGGRAVPQSTAAAARIPAPEPQPGTGTSSPAAAQPRSRPVVPAAATAAGRVKQEESSRDSAPTVAAILADRDNRFLALVGDALVSEGSMVHGYRVRQVRADSVEFEKDGRTWLQKLN